MKTQLSSYQLGYIAELHLQMDVVVVPKLKKKQESYSVFACG